MSTFRWQKPTKNILDRPISVFFAGALSGLLLPCVFFFFLFTLDSITIKSPQNYKCNYVNLQFDPSISTFYDDPSFGYTIDDSIKNWDEKRQKWLKVHPSFKPKSQQRVFMITGSNSKPCTSPTGDHFLLRFYRNKVDYCRIHGYDIFYNNVLEDPNMPSAWAKIPIVRAAMVAHPEVEWIWWLDADAVITDLEFKLPLHRYKDYNFVVHGWPLEVYEKKSWVGLNAGSFLIRNCQWSLNFLDSWADMGPRSPNFDYWNNIFLDVIKHDSNDQVALVYLYSMKHHQQSGKKLFIETKYDLHGYWLAIVDKLENITERNLELERTEGGMLRRRHAEKVSEHYGVLRESFLKDAGDEYRRPFVTHFTGCQPCNGHHDPMYTADHCVNGMNKALNFADDQVLRNYGFIHLNLSDSRNIYPVPFDYPA